MKMINRILGKWFYGKPAAGEKVEYNKGLQIKGTVVPKAFMESFKWDSHLYNNINVIE